MKLIVGFGLIIRLILYVAAYGVSAYSLFKIAKRNGVRLPFLAFIPVLQYYVIGSICEEYVLWGYRIKHLSVVMCLLALLQATTGFLNFGTGMIVGFAVNTLIALILHKFFYLFSPREALIYSFLSLIGGQLIFAVILLFIKDKPMLMSAAAYNYPFGERR